MTHDDQPADPLYTPLDDAELLAMRAERRERGFKLSFKELENGKEGQKLFAQHHHANRLLALTVAADHGKAFVRFAVLLNGGAVIAILTLIGTLYGKSGTQLHLVAAFSGKLQVGLYFFLTGLVTATLIAAAALWQWFFYAQTFFHEGQTANSVSFNKPFGPDQAAEINSVFDRYDRASLTAVWVCTALGAASMTSFVMGALKTAKAFAFFSLLR